MAIKRLYDTLVGATVNVNQLVNKNTLPATNTINGVTFTNNGDGIITVNGTATELTRLDGILGAKTWIAHKYLLIGCPAGGSHETYSIALRGAGADSRDEGSGVLWDASVNPYKGIVIYINPGFAVSNLQFKPQFFDLTAMFGSSIADYLYSLESATAGAGIAKLKEWGFFTGEYIPYNAGSLESVEATAHKMVGFNQWDEEWEVGLIAVATGQNINGSGIRSKNMCKCLPNTGYYTVIPYTYSRYIFWYNSNGDFISQMPTPASGIVISPSNAFYFRLRIDTTLTYNHDICINLSSDRNGEYEPYSAHTYDLGTDTLRGLFKLDANNQLYADGDVKTADGVITRKYGIRAYQSGDESLADAITDGTTTVYKLTTPTTEQGDPFPSPQVCYPDGTEEYITESGVPVGHETKYEL